jgi:hypothetical protein
VNAGTTTCLSFFIGERINTDVQKEYMFDVKGQAHSENVN